MIKINNHRPTYCFPLAFDFGLTSFFTAVYNVLRSPTTEEMQSYRLVEHFQCVSILGVDILSIKIRHLRTFEG